MRLDLVTRPTSRAWVMTSSERSYRNAGRIRLKMRGTVSMLCASTSGWESNTSRSRAGSPLKSGISNSTPQPGAEPVDLPDGLRVQPRTAVGQVVAGDAGDGRVAQPHRGHRLGHPARLVGVEVRRPASVDLAEVAPPGALIAADEEGGLAVLPTFVDVGAAGLLAHRVQALPLDQAAQLGELRAHGRLDLDPRRLALDRGLRVAGLDAQHAAGLPGQPSSRLQPSPGGAAKAGSAASGRRGSRRDQDRSWSRRAGRCYGAEAKR